MEKKMTRREFVKASLATERWFPGIDKSRPPARSCLGLKCVIIKDQDY